MLNSLVILSSYTPGNHVLIIGEKGLIFCRLFKAETYFGISRIIFLFFFFAREYIIKKWLEIIMLFRYKSYYLTQSWGEQRWINTFAKCVFVCKWMSQSRLEFERSSLISHFTGWSVKASIGNGEYQIRKIHIHFAGEIAFRIHRHLLCATSF